LVADQLAEYAQFFRFGTEVPSPPLVRGLGVGVGQLMRTAVEKANPVRADIKLGICGEHGGDPESVKFCHRIGLNYVSCSPFRVPIARLAAAQAAIGDGKERDN
jgi:pyruvate,orthophosphate dikinase